MPGRKVEPARRTTDSHLKRERARTDDEFAKRTAVADQEADDVVRTARHRATELLRAERERADTISQKRELSQAEGEAITHDRIRADQALRDEHVRADELVADERAERARIVVELFERERGETDKGLLLERGAADELLSRREEFLGMVSHDLRNELSGISMSVAQIMQRAPNDDVGRRIFRSATNVQSITLRMSRLLGDLLDVASIEAGKLMVVPDDDDVKRVIESAIESFQPVAAAKGIVLTVETTAECTPLKFDHQRIYQVLGNLLTNALRFTPQGGSVTIRVGRQGSETCLSVSDSGPGIAAERLEMIFEPFAQGPLADRKGVGLGLYIARRIVEAHRGRIWAESVLGHGSTFCFTLPERPNTEA
jgi:signal transduction histidine kinase